MAVSDPHDSDEVECNATSPGNEEKISAFLSRCGLRASAIPRAHEFARRNFPGREVAVAPFQGYCSYTLLLLPPDGRRDSGCEVGKGKPGSSVNDGDRLVQFRPRRHGIDVKVCAEARKVLGCGVVPEVEEVGVSRDLETEDGGNGGVLYGYVIEMVGGLSLTEFRRMMIPLDGRRESRREVVRNLAGVFANSWTGRRDGRAIQRGKVGGSLRWRLGIMQEGLPAEFRGVLKRVAKEMGGIEGLPWVITHGDLVSDNIMVRPNGDRPGGLVGLIDWAEAEWLPFGVGMYGLEEVLGEDVLVDDDALVTGSSRFEYYPEAEELRALFWDEVGKVVDDEEVVRKAKWAQVLGVLLWRGIAFDDGALGRVVDVEGDWWDVQRLRAWLFDERGLGMVPGPGEEWWERVWRWVGGCFGNSR